jgi:hypothetical protein
VVVLQLPFLLSTAGLIAKDENRQPVWCPTRGKARDSAAAVAGFLEESSWHFGQFPQQAHVLLVADLQPVAGYRVVG